MGSPFFAAVVAKIVIQSIEERALATYYQQKLPFWFHYVHDTNTALQQDHIESFHNYINEQNCDIRFTKDMEENGTIPFLDCLVSHVNNNKNCGLQFTENPRIRKDYWKGLIWR